MTPPRKPRGRPVPRPVGRPSLGPRVPVLVRLAPELLASLDAMADRAGQSRTVAIERAIRAAVERARLG